MIYWYSLFFPFSPSSLSTLFFFYPAFILFSLLPIFNWTLHHLTFCFAFLLIYLLSFFTFSHYSLPASIPSDHVHVSIFISPSPSFVSLPASSPISILRISIFISFYSLQASILSHLAHTSIFISPYSANPFPQSLSIPRTSILIPLSTLQPPSIHPFSSRPRKHLHLSISFAPSLPSISQHHRLSPSALLSLPPHLAHASIFISPSPASLSNHIPQAPLSQTPD